MRCPNCNTDIADHLNVCWFCGSNLITLENFLNKKNKIIVIIGVFGALSIYLSQTAVNNNNNFFLQFGSGISLLIMTALASLLTKECYSFIQKFPKYREYQGTGYSKWFRQTTELLYLWIFFTGFFSIVIFVLLFMLFFSNINEFVLKIIFGCVLAILFVPFIILPSDYFVRQKIWWKQFILLLMYEFLIFYEILLFLKDITNILSFAFFTDIVLIGVSFIGYWNVLQILWETANEKGESNRY